MKPLLYIIRIRRGGGSIDIARKQREAEWALLRRGLEIIRRELNKVAFKQKSQPIVVIHISEGATSLSVLDRWIPHVLAEVARYNGLVIVFMNIGEGLGEITYEEWSRRLEAIMNFLKSRGHPPVIMTTNCFRQGDQIIFSKEQFDERYLTIAYIIDRCGAGEPLYDELSNLLTPGSIHTVSTPFSAADYQEFMRNQYHGLSLMFCGLAEGDAPLVEGSLKRIDGVVLISDEKEYLSSIAKSFGEELRGRIVAYVVSEENESSLIPVVRSEKRPRSWVVGIFHGFFTAKLTVEEVEAALTRLREHFRAGKAEM
mgnify:CR=1 FL=1